MSYTVEDVDQVIYYEAVTEYGDCGWDAWKYEEFPNGAESRLGFIELEAEHGGGEGSGEEYWVVIKITDAEGNVRYFRKDGAYFSYVGGELNGDTYEVRPTPKTITEYV